jgi:hypothetical protein
MTIPYTGMRLAHARGTLREIIDMARKGQDAPLTAERWLERIEELALETIERTEDEE